MNACIRRIPVIAAAVSVAALVNAATMDRAATQHVQPVEVLVADLKVYRLRSPFPFPVRVKLYADGSPGFPKVVWVPAPPAPPVPVPYPSDSMSVRVQKPGGGWSPKFTIRWRPGNITLPGF